MSKDTAITKPQMLADKLHEFFQSIYAEGGVLVQQVSVEWEPGEGGLVVKNVNVDGWQK